MKVFVVNGPNLNMLGVRNPDVYGNDSLQNLEKMLLEHAGKLQIDIEFYQSNCEGEIIDILQKAYKEADAVVINPGAYTHYSYAIHDAIESIKIPCVEVHISNIHKREDFRHKSVTAPACVGQICGLGLKGYVYALEAAKDAANR